MFLKCDKMGHTTILSVLHNRLWCSICGLTLLLLINSKNHLGTMTEGVISYFEWPNYVEENHSVPFLSIVIPSFEGHLHSLLRNLESMAVFCMDCTSIPTYVIVSGAEKDLFEKTLSTQWWSRVTSKAFLNVTVLTIQDVYDRTFASLYDYSDTFKMNSSSHDMQVAYENVISSPEGKHLFQSYKKLYGCLATRAENCFCTDSESFMLRPVHMMHVAGRYLSTSAVLYNPLYQHGCGNVPSTMPRQSSCHGYHSKVPDGDKYMLGAECENSRKTINYATENYHWIFRSAHVHEAITYFHEHKTSLVHIAFSWFHDGSASPGKIFGEEIFYQYLACFPKRYPEYQFVDTTSPNIYSSAAETFKLRDELVQIGQPLSYFENLGRNIRQLVDIYPQYVQDIADFLLKYNIPTFSAAPTNDRNLLLSETLLRSANISWCTSWCHDSILRNAYKQWHIGPPSQEGQQT